MRFKPLQQAADKSADTILLSIEQCCEPQVPSYHAQLRIDKMEMLTSGITVGFHEKELVDGSLVHGEAGSRRVTTGYGRDENRGIQEEGREKNSEVLQSNMPSPREGNQPILDKKFVSELTMTTRAVRVTT